MQDQASPCDVPNPSSHTSRRRASKACLACRARKVRCDVVHREGQCTNCALDKRQCIVKCRPSKYRSLKKTSNSNTTQKESDSLPTCPSQEQGQEQQQQQERFASDVFPCSPLDPASTTSERSPEECQENPPISSRASWDTLGDSSNDNIFAKIHPELRDQTPRALRTASNTRNDEPGSSLYSSSGEICFDQAHVIYSYFHFLEADLSLLSQHDVQFLEAQGCFKVPGRQAADEFVREYFRHVHPSLPLLNESVFWNMYFQDAYPAQDRRTSLSLFVFQAMLFASCSFLSPMTIESLGFTSPRNARATYYRRAKLLFDFCGERNPIANAQGALLLSYNATMRDQKRTNSIWLATAIQLAQAAGAHQPDYDLDQGPEVGNSLKRLWWCCIVRDRILPLGVRRQLHISLADFDAEKTALTEDDFADEIAGSRVYDAETKRSLVRLFITLCDLAVSLTDVIMTVYATGQPTDIRLLSIPKLRQTTDCIHSCKLGLDAWFERATIRFPTPAGIMSSNKSLILYTNLMYIYYHSARLALYQYEALILGTGSIEHDGNALRQSRLQLEDDAAGITGNLKEIIQLRLGKYLPISIVAYAALPIVLHILDVKLSTKPSQTAQKQGRLNVYIEAMKGLQTQYDGVDDVWDFIRRAVEYATLVDQTPERTHASIISGSIPKHANPTRSLSSKASGALATVSDWGHMLLQQPTIYFRLVQTIDSSLSTGRCHEDCWFLKLPKSASFPLSRFFIGDRNDEARRNQDPEHIEESNPQRTFEPLEVDLQGHKDILDQPASALHISGELEGAVDLDYGLADLDMPMFLDGFDPDFEDTESTMFASFLS